MIISLGYASKETKVSFLPLQNQSDLDGTVRSKFGGTNNVTCVNDSAKAEKNPITQNPIPC